MALNKETVISDVLVGTTLLVLGGTFGYVTLIADLRAQTASNSQAIAAHAKIIDKVPILIERLESAQGDVHRLEVKMEEVRELQTKILIELRSKRQ